MTRSGDLVFPLIPSRRGGAFDVAGNQSRRRGSGRELASSRPYRRGDPIRLVDWAASARLSTARAADEFVVRDHFAEETVKIVVVVDKSRSMALYPDWLPSLDKQAAVRASGSMIVASGGVANALIGFAAVGGGAAHVSPPRRDPGQWRATEQRLALVEPEGPPDSLELALGLLARSARIVLPGTFVFVLSDFLPPLRRARLQDALAAGWDVVPVVIQDPVWERSFPDVSGVTLPVFDPDDGKPALVRLTRKGVRTRRESNERRAADLDLSLRELGLDPVSITRSDRESVHAAFLTWAEGRRSRSRGYR